MQRMDEDNPMIGHRKKKEVVSPVTPLEVGMALIIALGALNWLL
jgi:hypothetical protein